jgi:hypothetical protein
MRISAPKLLVLACIMAGSASQAQVKLPVTNNDLRINLEKIIADFPHQLDALKGDTLADNPQTIEFSSRLNFNMAPDNVITQYKSEKPIYSWSAVLLKTEEFDEAVKKYKWLCNQLKVMTVTLEGGYAYTMSGNYDIPEESRKFSSSIFHLTPRAMELPKLKIEAAMQFEFPEWKVTLLVYEKEREDQEQGDIHGGK